jgi:hypothetical protein
VERVKLPKTIATYIEDLLIGGTNESLLAGVLGSANSPKYIAVRKHFENDFDSLLKVLVAGYEVIEEPLVVTIQPDQIERLIAYRNLNRPGANETQSNFNIKAATGDGIDGTLRILGIKIGGVNA